MLDTLKSNLSWLYLQYTFMTGIYLLDKSEVIIFNFFTLGKVDHTCFFSRKSFSSTRKAIISLMIYSCIVYLPAYCVKLYDQAAILVRL